MTTGRAGVDLIKSFEGLCRTAYKLAGETYYTIGYGHYGEDVKAGQSITEAQAVALLQKDLARFEGYVRTYAPAGLNQNQFDALVSFTYNCGPGSLQQLCTGRTPAQIPAHIEAYTRSSSPAYTAGLLRRRQAEKKLYLTPATVTKEDENMTGEEIYNKLMAYLRTLPTSDYARESSKKAIGSGVFKDGDTDGLVDNPRSFVLRQDLATVLNRAGLLK